MKDYYKILGVAPNADKEEIKQAFKKLAKKFHPDANRGKKDAEDKFKEISEAYDVLSNERTRQEYDLTRESERFGRVPRGSSFSSNDGFPGSVEELFKQFASKGRDGLRSSIFGEGGFNAPGGDFGDFFGGGSPGPSAATLRVPLKIACKGGQIQVSGIPGGSRKVDIPPGSRKGSVITVSTSKGPFKLELILEDDPPFFIKGDQVETTLNINLAQAVLGTKIKFKDPRDEEIILPIPAGTQPDDVLRLRKMGIGHGGDLYVRLKIVIPQKLSPKEKELFLAFIESACLKY